MTRRVAVPVVLFVLAAALVVTGLVLVTHPRHRGAPSDVAVVDRAATTEVIGQVSTALTQVLSYDYAKPEPAKAAAAKWLTGDAVGQYQTLFQQLNRNGPNQKLSFVAKVVTAGVTTLEGDTAQLLVFVDQKSTRASDHASTVAAAEVLIRAERANGTWRISELVPL